MNESFLYFPSRSITGYSMNRGNSRKVMESKNQTTHFASAERSSSETVQQQNVMIRSNISNHHFLDAIPDIFLILNRDRQIIYTNRAILDFLGLDDPHCVQGFRPGEILNCVHAFDSPAGCGTSEFCRACGAARAILKSLEGESTVEECRILRRESCEAIDLRVWATPYHVNGDVYSIFVVSDVSHEKRRKSLERIFYHDVLNTAGGLLGFARILRNADGEKVEFLRERIYALANKLIEEIKAQRELSAAENNELTVTPVSVSSKLILFEITDLFRSHEVAVNRSIVIDPNAQDIDFLCDPVLLRRVIGNMIKNALESTHPGETVTLGCDAVHDGIQYWVHNPSYIPPDVQLQIFHRSFSTKGSGRGLGTYSIKLLSERYLKGTASFTSTPETGTRFIVWYPRNL